MIDSPKIAGLSAYLEKTGWERQSVGWRGSTIWVHSGGRVASVPKKVMGDFELRYLDAVESIARTEQRDVAQVLETLHRFRTDTQSFRVVPNELPSGFVGLTSAVSSMQSIANIYRFAARSVIQGANSEFKGQAPNEVNELVRDMRLGQSAAGSFVFNIHVPLPVPSFQRSANENEPDRNGGLARQVLVQLHRAVSRIAEAQGTYRDERVDVQPTELIEHGVSAELCHELAKLSLDEDSSPFEIEFHWAYGVKGELEDGSVEFSEGAGTFLKGLEEHVRRVREGARARLTGEVVHLTHTGPNEPWLVKVKGELVLSSGSLSSSRGTTWVMLDADQYSEAYRANRHHLRVEAEGVFQRQRRRFELNSQHGNGSLSIAD